MTLHMMSLEKLKQLCIEHIDVLLGQHMPGAFHQPHFRPRDPCREILRMLGRGVLVILTLHHQHRAADERKHRPHVPAKRFHAVPAIEPVMEGALIFLAMGTLQTLPEAPILLKCPFHTQDARLHLGFHVDMGCHQNQAGHLLGVLDREIQRKRTAITVPHQGGFLDT